MAADGVKPPQVEVDYTETTASLVSVEEKANETISPERDILDDILDMRQGDISNTTQGQDLNVNLKGDHRPKRGRTESPTDAQTTLHGIKPSKPAGKKKK